MNHSGARIDFGEHHVKGDLHITDNITISNLNVLNFCCISLSFKSLHTHKLDFYRLDHEFRILGYDKAIEGLVESTICRIDCAFEAELGNLFPWANF